jgi:hypothetical protein
MTISKNQLKQVHLKFLEQLVISNLLFIESNNIKNNIFFSEIIIKNVKEKKKFLFLDPVILVKSLKQEIRIFQFLKEMNLNGFSIKTPNNNSFFLKLFNKVLVDVKGIDTPKIFFRNNKNSIIKDTISHLIFLNNEKKFIIKNLLDENIFLITKIKKEFSKNNFGFYKIFSSLDEWKKIVFILLLIKKLIY